VTCLGKVINEVSLTKDKKKKKLLQSKTIFKVRLTLNYSNLDIEMLDVVRLLKVFPCFTLNDNQS